MTIDLNLAGSRPAGVAQELLGKRVSVEDLYSRHVVLQGEPAVLATANGRWIFLDALRLLLCVVGRLTIVVPTRESDLRRQVEVLVARAFSRCRPIIVDDASPLDARDVVAILNVGTEVCDPNTCTAVASNGWMAHVSSQRSLAIHAFGQANPIGALMAASLGVAEVFKRVIGVPAEVAGPVDRAAVSLFDFSTEDPSAGPALPAELLLEHALLIGAGAIGNGIALLLSQLPLRGSIEVLDKQDYGVENLGTCLLMEPEGWLGPKAERLVRWLAANSKLTTTWKKSTIQAAIASGHFKKSPKIVLNGLDDVPARRETQRLWPQVLIDGAINPIGAAVIQYRLARPESGCLMCWFEEEPVDAKVAQSRVTGLRVDSLDDISRQLTDEDIANADPERRAWLLECKRQGKTICATFTSAAELEQRLGVKAEASFRPSVPFVATAAAALVMAEAVKAVAFPAVKSPAMFHMGNLFLGPEHSMPVHRHPSPRCQCVVQRKALERLLLAAAEP